MTRTSPFIKHHIASCLLPADNSTLYDYVLAGNGVFIRGKRRELSVLFPIVEHPIAGLPPIAGRLTLTIPRIPQRLIQKLMEEALGACAEPAGPVESLFHFEHDTDWCMTIPDQIRTPFSVQPSTPERCPSYERAIVEIHSHHTMAPRFSVVDNEDETGFRIYGVCGWLTTRPSITFRVGLYGHFIPIPAEFVAELPPTLQDTYRQ